MAGEPTEPADADDQQAAAKTTKATRKRGVPFNPDEPHGTIHGGKTRARYVQDGRYYDAKFDPCEF